ncbi:MAG: FkbM family methyltransferase [Candidatus Cloacimonetes bacterium]|nr:FkbM family methyltransferase [Candidatus Cloacimonadota bacterium]
MKVFIDIGAHIGETLQEVRKPEYGFDKIYAFEPVIGNCGFIIDNFHDSRICILPYGLLNKTAELKVYNPGSDGATIFKNKKGVVENKLETVCQFIKASLWFKEDVNADDENIVKINAEGSEVAIINDLLSNDEYDKIDKIFIDFDVRKIPEMKHLEKKTIKKLEKLGYTNFVTQNDIKRRGKHPVDVAGNRIKDWLGDAKDS